MLTGRLDLEKGTGDPPNDKQCQSQRRFNLTNAEFLSNRSVAWAVYRRSDIDTERQQAKFASDKAFFEQTPAEDGKISGRYSRQ